MTKVSRIGIGFCQLGFLFIVRVYVLLLVFQSVSVYNHSCLSTQASLPCLLNQFLNWPYPLASSVCLILALEQWV